MEIKVGRIGYGYGYGRYNYVSYQSMVYFISLLYMEKEEIKSNGYKATENTMKQYGNIGMNKGNSNMDNFDNCFKAFPISHLFLLSV